MKNRHLKPKHSTEKQITRHLKSSSFSEGAIAVAKNELKKFESQSNEGFLIRAEMERKLSSF